MVEVAGRTGAPAPDAVEVDAGLLGAVGGVEERDGDDTERAGEAVGLVEEGLACCCRGCWAAVSCEAARGLCSFL